MTYSADSPSSVGAHLIYVRIRAIDFKISTRAYEAASVENGSAQERTGVFGAGVDSLEKGGRRTSSILPPSYLGHISIVGRGWQYPYLVPSA